MDCYVGLIIQYLLLESFKDVLLSLLPLCFLFVCFTLPFLVTILGCRISVWISLCLSLKPLHRQESASVGVGIFERRGSRVSHVQWWLSRVLPY